MLSALYVCKPRFLLNRIASMFLGVLAIVLMGGGLLRAQVVATYTFNDGTADGWTSFNGSSTPTASSAETDGGASFSLLTETNPTNGQGGPSINLPTGVQAGAQYTITGFVRLASGEPAENVNFTMKVTDATGCASSAGTCFTTVGGFEDPVTDSAWAPIGGSFTASTTETGLTLYAQLVNGPTTPLSFYLADVVITETAPPPGGTPVATYTWKDGGLDGWTPYGNVTLENARPSPTDPLGDSNALLTPGRGATYKGPSLNLLGVAGGEAG